VRVVFDAVRWIHLLAAAVWTGGLITLGALVPALRKAGADRPLLQAMARQFSRVSWSAMAVAVVTGVIKLIRLDLDTDVRTEYGRRLFLKLSLVGLAAALALAHQLTARTTGPAVRGILQATILVVSLGIFAAAVAL
jgi:putative copper export protein